MDRVIFYDEHTASRIDALLNPETLTWTRRAGLRLRRLDELPIAAAAQSDDTLIHTGGGETEIALELLFDTRLLPATGAAAPPGLGSAGASADVRRLTEPLWALAENRSQGAGVRIATGSGSAPRPRPQRLIWGEWSLSVVVVAVAERFEDFSPEGVPRRSWMALTLRRVPEDEAARPAAESVPQGPPAIGDDVGRQIEALTQGSTAADGSLTSAIVETSGGVGRLDLAAAELFGDPRQWRLVAELNGLEDPLAAPSGGTLVGPSGPGLGGGAR
jgi:hypothetical protein